MPNFFPVPDSFITDVASTSGYVFTGLTGLLTPILGFLLPVLAVVIILGLFIRR